MESTATQALAPSRDAKRPGDARGNTSICDSPVSEHELEVAQPSSSLMYLIIVRGGIPGTMFRLPRGTISLGRSVENTFPLPEDTVSRRHATISVDVNGTARLTDVGSTNGTFLNGSRLAVNRPVRVGDGSRIQLGSAVLLKFVRLDPCDEVFQREMYERTVRDELTGLFNRSYFLSRVGQLAGDGSSRDMGLALILIDVDHFKRINDAHGHAVGDQVLRQVGCMLRDSTRAEDLVARYGGEEFVIALPCHGLEQAIDRAERVRATLADRRVEAAGRDIRVTASFGLSFSPAGCVRNLPWLIATADEALYLAKRRGRNRVVCSSQAAVEAASRTESADGFVVFEPETEASSEQSPALARRRGHSGSL
jgi:diguanylate cyclase (GGDEF)-like protein